MNKEKWQKFEVEFKVNKEPTIVIVYHDLPLTPGLNIDGAFTNWVHRTNEHTSVSFADYINSKSHMTGNKAYTPIEWESIKDKNDD